MNRGLGSIMLAHLFIPALDDTLDKLLLWHEVGRDLLRDSLDFRGLVFSVPSTCRAWQLHFDPGELGKSIPGR